MPFYKKIEINAHTTAYIWKIGEDFNALFRGILLKDTSLARVESMKDTRHQKGFLSIRHLLQYVGFSDFDLFYDTNGKPHLKTPNQAEKHISITHSFDFSAIIISTEKVGIDIELRRDKVQRIAKKFVAKEFAFVSNLDKNYTNLLTVIWGVKESIYKLYNQKGLSFIENITVHPFAINDQKGTAEVLFLDKKTHYRFLFEEIENYTLVIALEKNN